MTNMRKTTIVISFPSDEMPIEKVEEIVKMIQRFTKSNLREQGGHTASENFRQEHMSDIVCMEDHEQWWYPDRFGHNDPKISVQFTNRRYPSFFFTCVCSWSGCVPQFLLFFH